MEDLFYMKGCTICDDGLVKRVQQLVDNGGSVNQSCKDVVEEVNSNLGCDLVTLCAIRGKYQRLTGKVPMTYRRKKATIPGSNNKILVFGDLHAPYQDENALTFLRKTRDKFKPDRVVCVGDMVDFYAASRFPKDPDHPDSMPNEILKIRKTVQKLAKIFPKMDVTMGNHDDRMAIRAAGAGIPKELMASFNDILGGPKGWTFHPSQDDFTVEVQETGEKITFAHNRGINTLLIAQRLGRTYVAGHSHTKGQVVGYNNGESTIFGVNNPCLISNEGSPFAYSKISNINPVRGCTLIEDGVPRLVML